MTRAYPLCLSAVLCLALTACSERAPEPADAEAAALPVPTRIIDLSPVITEDLPLRKVGTVALAALGLPERTEFDVRAVDEPTHISITVLELVNHVGPHVDVPGHLEPGAPFVDDVPLDRLVGPLKVLDFRSAPKDEPIGVEAVQAHEIEPGDVVVLLVDYDPPTAPDEAASYAYLSKAAAEHLASIPVRAFGTTAMSVDSFRELGAKMAAGETGYEPLLPVHHAFLTRGIPTMEGLENVEEAVDLESALFVALPLKIADGDGSPIRPAVFVY